MSPSRTVSEIDGDFSRKSPIFPTPRMFNAPAEGVPWNKVRTQEIRKTRMMWLSDGRKSFEIGLAVQTQYRRVTDGHPARHLSTARTALA